METKKHSATKNIRANHHYLADQSAFFKESNAMYPPKTQEHSTNKKTTSFVVDWQLGDKK